MIIIIKALQHDVLPNASQCIMKSHYKQMQDASFTHCHMMHKHTQVPQQMHAHDASVAHCIITNKHIQGH